MVAKILLLLALVAAPALGSSVKGHADTKGLGRIEQFPAKAPEEPKQLAIEELRAQERLETVELQSGQQQEEHFQRTEELKSPAAQLRYEARPQVARREKIQRAEEVKAPAQVAKLETKAPLARKEKIQRTEESKAPIAQVRHESKQQISREEQFQRAEGVKAPLAQLKLEPRPVQVVQERLEEIKAPIAQIRQETKAPVSREEHVQRIEEVKAPIAQTRYVQRPLQLELFKQTEQQREAQEEAGWKTDEQRRLVEDQPALIQPIAPLTVVEETHRDQFQQQQQLQIAGTKGAPVALVQAPFVEAEPYAFSYQVDGSSRSESGDSRGVVRGQYTLQGADGANRIVDYIADANGFRATVNTNEFGTEARSPANVVMRSNQPLAEEITTRQEAKKGETWTFA